MGKDMATNWQNISKEAQANLLQSIPPRWRIDATSYDHLSDVTRVPLTCGLLSPRQIEITELTVTELAACIRSRTLRATEILEAFVGRAAIAHQLVFCLTDWFYDEALERCKALDAMLDSGGEPMGPLHGIPVALKDTYSVKGHVTTRGYVINKAEPTISGHDSDVVRILREAGAVFFCRTAMPQTGFILETVSNLWGRTLNPFNRNLGAGGSSGGDGALVAMKGCPIAPSSDIGGSIRAPAAFNGLYALRPTAMRVPKNLWEGTMTGQMSIRDSAGPVCHSVDDVRLFTRLLVANEKARYDTNAVPVPWREVKLPQKLCVGIMKWDRVVMPQTPVLRAIEHTQRVLLEAGYEVVKFEPPFDCWELVKCFFDINFQMGGQDTIVKVTDAGEPLVPAFADLLKVYSAMSLTASESMQLNLKMRAFKVHFANAWDKTKDSTPTGRPIDALICPVAPSAGIPHDFNIYWGYTCMWNLLDYPSTVLPIPNFKITSETDPPDLAYDPLTTNPYDKANHEMYDPALFSNQPSTIQIVGRPFDDEELIEITAAIDEQLRSRDRVSSKL
ncbi:hypothetical protein FALCPG4_005712 [Fusarium falciforme]